MWYKIQNRSCIKIQRSQQTCGLICRLRNDFNDPFRRSNNDKSVGALSWISSFEEYVPIIMCET